MEQLGCGYNGKKRILVLEDSPDMLEIYHDLLDSMYELEAVDNCDEGLGLVEANNICGVIADVSLRGRGTGLEFLANCGKKVPVIIVTAYGNLYREEAEKRGAKDYFSKPFDIDKLVSSVEQYFH